MTTNKTHEVLTGICSCCLGRFVVEGQRNVKHGYRRPGDGREHGECVGLRFPCYEVSTEGCEAMRDMYKRTAEEKRNYAGRCRAGQVTSIVKEKTSYEGWGKQKHVKVVLTPASSREELRVLGYYCWDDVIEAEARTAGCDAKDADRDAKDFQDMIDAWKPGLEFVSEERLNAEKQAVVEAKRAEAQFKRDCKRNKALFFHIGAAISKHKKGWLHASWDWKDSPAYADLARLAPFAEMYPKTKKGKK